MKKPTKLQLRQASERSRIKISDWVCDERIEKGLSQEALANIAGVDRKTINRIENGHFSPSIDTMVLIALALNADIPELF